MYRSNYRKRLEDAIKHFRFHKYDYKTMKRNKKVPIKSVEDLFDAMEKRATTEQQLRKAFGWIISLLEPPSCIKSHCKHYTAYAFCYCDDGRIPGRCPDHKKYIKGRKERREKILFEIKRCIVAYSYHETECKMCSDGRIDCDMAMAIATKTKDLAEKISLWPWKEKVREIQEELLEYKYTGTTRCEDD